MAAMRCGSRALSSASDRVVSCAEALEPRRLLADVGDVIHAARGVTLGNEVGLWAGSETLGNGTAGARDVDVYALVGTAGQRFMARTSVLPFADAVETRLALFDAAGNRVAQGVADELNGYVSQLRHQLAEGGVYYLAVSGKGNTGFHPLTGAGTAAGDTGDYQLLMRLWGEPGQSAGGEIAGVLFGDRNLDGARGAAETGVEREAVYLDLDESGHYSEGDRVFVTTTGGFYHFVDLAAGAYTVRLLPGSQYQPTSPPEGFHAVALTDSGAGGSVVDADFGFRLPPTTVMVKVFQDADADGVMDGDEPGAEGVSVHLVDPVNGLLGDGDDVAVAQGVTGPLGVVTFAGAAEGTYAVKVERPGTVPFSVRDAGDEALDSDVDAMTGLTDLFYAPRDAVSEITAGLDARRRVTGTQGDDTLYVRLDESGQVVEVFLDDEPGETPAYVLPRSSFLSLLLETGGGDDVVIVDLVNGNPAPANGVFYEGGTGTDALRVMGDGVAAAFKATASDGAMVTLDSRHVQASAVEGYELREHATLAYVTPSGADVVTAAGGRVTGVSGGIVLPPVEIAEVGELAFDLAAGESAAANDTLTVGPAALNVASVLIKSGGGNDVVRVLGGSVRLTPAGSTSLSLLTAGAAAVTLVNAPDLDALTLLDGSRVSFPTGATRAPRVNSVTIAAGAMLDTADTNLIVRAVAGTRHGISQELGASARGGGLFSSVAAADPRGITGLAVVVNDEGTEPGAGEVLLRRFGNRPVDSSSVIVKHTYHGDADLSGFITIDDYFRIDAGYSRRARFSGGNLPNYRDGDFDYDGRVTAGDFMLIDRAFLGQTVRYDAGQAGRAAEPPPGQGDDVGGWTEFAPSPDSRVVYVSNSQGSDSNSGLSADAPVRTLAKAKGLMRGGKPDWMLLKRGDVWSDEQLAEWTVGGRSAEEPMLISAYGDAPERPVIEWNGVGAALSMRLGREINHLAVVGIHFSGGPNVAGSGVHRLSPGENFLIEDCVFEGFGTGLVVHGFYAPIGDVTIRRSVIADNAPRSGRGHGQGLFIDRVDGLLIEENVIDRNGWRAANRSDATIFNHNIYLTADNEDVVVRRNIIARASSHGLQARAGGVIEDNFFVGNPIGM